MPLVHQQHVTLSQLPGGQRESHPLESAGRRWPPRPQDASRRCAPPTAGPQEAQNGPASAPDAFAAGKPGPMPLPLFPSPVRAPGGKQTWGREPAFCFHLRTGARAEGQLPAPSRCLPPSSSSLSPPLPPPYPLWGLTQATFGSNQTQDCARASKQGLARVSKRRWTGPSLSGSGGRAPFIMGLWQEGNQEQRKTGKGHKAAALGS